MRVSALIVAALALLAALVCVRLGIWQLGRWHEKQALERTRRERLAEPSLTLDGARLADGGTVAGRRVTIAGVWDTARVVLLIARSHADAPGVELTRPLVTPAGRVMVVRGWLSAEDGVHAAITDSLARDTVRLSGLAEPLRRGAGGWAPEPLPGARGVWTARWLDVDSLARVIPGPVADWSLRELPSPDAPSQPLREEPAAIDASMHVSYTIQWFVFAAAFVAGAIVTLGRGRRRDRDV